MATPTPTADNPYATITLINPPKDPSEAWASQINYGHFISYYCLGALAIWTICRWTQIFSDKHSQKQYMTARTGSPNSTPRNSKATATSAITTEDPDLLSPPPTAPTHSSTSPDLYRLKKANDQDNFRRHAAPCQPNQHDTVRENAAPTYRRLQAAFRYLAYRRIPHRISRYFPTSSMPSSGMAIFLLCASGFLAGLIISQQNFYRESLRFGAPPLSLRSALMATALLPAQIALAGKSNLVSFLTGIGHERLNVIHRWTGWASLALSLAHAMPYFWATENEFGRRGYEKVFDQFYKWIGPGIPYSGMPALIALGLICMISLHPIRSRVYEIFYGLHIFLGIFYVVALMWHSNDLVYSWSYIYAALIMWLGSWIWRFLWHQSATSIRIRSRAFLSSFSATLEAAAGNTTKVHVWLGDEADNGDESDNSTGTEKEKDNALVTAASRLRNHFAWSPGQHAFVRFVEIAPLESHPFTIATAYQQHPRPGATALATTATKVKPMSLKSDADSALERSFSFKRGGSRLERITLGRSRADSAASEAPGEAAEEDDRPCPLPDIPNLPSLETSIQQTLSQRRASSPFSIRSSRSFSLPTVTSPIFPPDVYFAQPSQAPTRSSSVYSTGTIASTTPLAPVASYAPSPMPITSAFTNLQSAPESTATNLRRLTQTKLSPLTSTRAPSPLSLHFPTIEDRATLQFAPLNRVSSPPPTRPGSTILLPSREIPTQNELSSNSAAPVSSRSRSLTFLIRTRCGMTKRLHDYLCSSSSETPGTASCNIYLDGPFGGINRPLENLYDTIVLAAGGSGVSIATSWISHIADAWVGGNPGSTGGGGRSASPALNGPGNGIPGTSGSTSVSPVVVEANDWIPPRTKRIVLVWAIRSTSSLDWIQDMLSSALATARVSRRAARLRGEPGKAGGLEIILRFFVTRRDPEIGSGVDGVTSEGGVGETGNENNGLRRSLGGLLGGETGLRRAGTYSTMIETIREPGSSSSSPRTAANGSTLGIGLPGIGGSLYSLQPLRNQSTGGPAERKMMALGKVIYGRPDLGEEVRNAVLPGERAFVIGCGPDPFRTDLGNAVAGEQTRVIGGECEEIGLHMESMGW